MILKKYVTKNNFFNVSKKFERNITVNNSVVPAFNFINFFFYFRPKLNTLLNITVYSQVKIKEIFWIAINRLGMVHSGKKECSNCKKLEFKVNVTKEMLPKSTFYVFASPKISNIETFVHNKIEVLFDQLSENYVRKNFKIY